MNLGGIIGGLIAGVVGAVLWAAIAYYANYEIAILAWGIGAAVGFGVSMGSSNGGIVPAVVAVLITAGSLVGGKYLAVQMAVRDMGQQLHSEEFAIDDELLVSSFAFEMADEKIASGKKLKFRNGVKDIALAEDVNDLPASLVKEAQAKLDALSQEEHDALITEKTAQFEQMLSAFEGEIAKQGFIESFSGIDILFFLLGIFTAGKIALSDYVHE